MRLAMAAALLIAAQPAVAAPPSDAQIAAIALPDAQLKMFLARTLFGTQSIARSLYLLGIAPGCEVVRPAFDKAFAETSVKWSENLILAYRQALPADVLEEAVQQTPAEASATIAPYAEAIGSKMQAQSMPLLRAAVTRIVEPVWNAAVKSGVKEADVDGPARQAEFKAAMADGTAFCGLAPTSPTPPPTPSTQGATN